MHWKSYQQNLISKLKELKEPVTIAGDGCHDSMGHSAKYGAYTIFCYTVPLIIHFSLVQVGSVPKSHPLFLHIYTHIHKPDV